MSPLKLMLGCFWAACCVFMWQQRALVIDAYTTDREPIDFQLSGVDLDVRSIADDPSPYQLNAAPDTRSVRLEPLFAPDVGSAPVEIFGGTGSVSGTVALGADPVPGATIELTRITARGEATHFLVSDESGEWIAEELLGGRYRARAYVPSVMASVGSAVLFLNDGSTSEGRALRVVQPVADTLIGMAGPDEIMVSPVAATDPTADASFDATVGITVGVRRVGADGRQVVVPSFGRQVSASFGAPVLLQSAAVVATDGQGASAFLVRCVAPGTSAVTVAVAGVPDLETGEISLTSTAVLTLPPCVPAPIPEEPLEGEAPLAEVVEP